MRIKGKKGSERRKKKEDRQRGKGRELKEDGERGRREFRVKRREMWIVADRGKKRGGRREGKE